MKRFIVFVVLAALAAFSGCNGGGGKLEASLEQDFSLAIGKVASISGQQLEVKFVEVVADSRCPAGVTCVWQGEASCLIEIAFQGAKQRMVLTQPGLTKGPAQASFGDYEIQFNVAPYPEAGKTIQNRDYRLQLTVDRKPALSGGILATFDLQGERYSVFTTNKTATEQVLALQRGESQVTIPSGRVVRGAALYNKPWS